MGNKYPYMENIMKKFVLAVALMFTSVSAFAHGPYYGGYYRGHYDWVAPLVVGGAVGYLLAQPRTVVVQQPQAVNLNQIYGPTQGVYQYQDIYFNDCSCYKRVLVQIN